MVITISGTDAFKDMSHVLTPRARFIIDFEKIKSKPISKLLWGDLHISTLNCLQKNDRVGRHAEWEQHADVELPPVIAGASAMARTTISTWLDYA